MKVKLQQDAGWLQLALEDGRSVQVFRSYELFATLLQGGEWETLRSDGDQGERQRRSRTAEEWLSAHAGSRFNVAGNAAAYLEALAS